MKRMLLIAAAATVAANSAFAGIDRVDQVRVPANSLLLKQTQPYNRQLPGEALPQQSDGFKLKQLPKIEPGPPLNYDKPDGGAPKPPPPPKPEPKPLPMPIPNPGPAPFPPCERCPRGTRQLRLNVQPDRYKLNVQPNQYRLQPGQLLQR